MLWQFGEGMVSACLQEDHKSFVFRCPFRCYIVEIMNFGGSVMHGDS